jgi:nicotinate-nucleotide adenylyltransferase
LKRTLLYFGSFNPVHIGHLAIANYAMVSGIADELWFVVSPQNPFKPADSLVSAADRVEMTRLALDRTGLDERVGVSEVELHLPVPSYTIQTLEALWAAYPERRFAILMGSDNLLGIPRWKEAERILQRCPIYVYHRPGFETERIDNRNIIELNDAPVLEIGSTRLRKWLAEGKYIPALLPSGVYEYIKEHGLYRIDN